MDDIRTRARTKDWAKGYDLVDWGRPKRWEKPRSDKQPDGEHKPHGTKRKNSIKV